MWQVITLTAAQLSGILVNGDNVIAVSVGQNATGSSDMVFAMQMWSEAAFPVTFTDTSGVTNRTVETCRSTTFSVVAAGSAPVTYQWSKAGVGPLLDQTNSTLVLSNLTVPDSGDYSVQVVNPLATISMNGTLTVVPDTTAPTVIKAIANPNLTTITVTYSEPVDALTAADPFSYTIQNSVNLVEVL